MVDGRPVRAYAGESLATALPATGITTFRSSPDGAPRSVAGDLCACLCSTRAGFITGQNVLIDSGACPETL